MAWRNTVIREREPRGGTEVSQDEIDQKPGIYMGYADFSRVVASDPDFFVLRRFDTLNARVLLTLHDNIAELDLKYSAPALGGDDLPDRARLIQDIGAKVAGV